MPLLMESCLPWLHLVRRWRPCNCKAALMSDQTAPRASPVRSHPNQQDRIEEWSNELCEWLICHIANFALGVAHKFYCCIICYLINTSYFNLRLLFPYSGDRFCNNMRPASDLLPYWGLFRLYHWVILRARQNVPIYVMLTQSEW